MPLVAIDTETGGLDPRENPLLSVSLIEVDENLNPKRSLNLFILPEEGKVITPEAVKVNGYTPELWAERGALTLTQAFNRLAGWLPRGSEMLAHNAPFDKGFIAAGEKTTGIDLRTSRHWRDSMIAFLFVTDALGLRTRGCGLGELAKISGHWGKDYQRGAHQASDDALACAAGYKWLLQQIVAGAR